MPLATGPQVAVYFVGEPRTLNGTLCSILDNIVQPLLAEKCRLAFFVYTPLGPGVEQYDLLAAVLKVPVVTRVVPRPPRPPPACVANLDRRVRLLNARYNEELLGHIRDMEAVDRERLAYEREHNVQFEWVVFARPDVTYVDPLPPLHSLSPSLARVRRHQRPVRHRSPIVHYPLLPPVQRPVHRGARQVVALVGLQPRADLWVAAPAVEGAPGGGP
eukprot:EG_transcript_9454